MSSNVTRLSRSAEDYLEAIGHLCRENGRAQVSDVAAMLNVKKPSVTAAVHQLAAEGLILVIRAHGILHRFLVESAGLAPERADEVACHMEHLLSIEEIESIGSRLN